MYWEMSSDENSDDGIKHLLQLNPSKFQKVTKYALFFCNYISGEFYIIVTGRD